MLEPGRGFASRSGVTRPSMFQILKIGAEIIHLAVMVNVRSPHLTGNAEALLNKHGTGVSQAGMRDCATGSVRVWRKAPI